MERRRAAAVPEPGIGAMRQQRLDSSSRNACEPPDAAGAVRSCLSSSDRNPIESGTRSWRLEPSDSIAAIPACRGRIVQRLGASPIPRAGTRAARDEVGRDVRSMGRRGDVQRSVARVDVMPDPGEKLRGRCPAAGADGRRCPGGDEANRQSGLKHRCDLLVAIARRTSISSSSLVLASAGAACGFRTITCQRFNA